MAKQKLKRFAEFSSFPNTFEESSAMQGKWSDFFENSRPIVLELACGKGEYTLGLAELRPEANYIGVDIKGNRMWRGALSAIDKGLHNVAFLRAQISHIESQFDPGEVSEIWITFADPHLRKGKAKKRLTHPVFLQKFKNIGQTDLRVHLKTDSAELYEFTKEVIHQLNLKVWHDIPDVYADKSRTDLIQIQTFYEKKWLLEGKKIMFLSFEIANISEEEDYRKLEFTL